MVEVVWSEEADRRLHGIYLHIAAENPAAAKKVIDAIYRKVQMLRSFPQMGQRYLPIRSALGKRRRDRSGASGSQRRGVGGSATSGRDGS